MDSRQNPYAPGAGSRPPELAGRGAIMERAAVALDRIRDGLHAQSIILVGLRGVGKTVLLNEIRRNADARGIETVTIEAPEHRSLPAMLAPPLKTALLRLDRGQAAASAAKRALGALRRFVGAFKVSFGDLEATIDLGEPVADTGDLETDLPELIDLVGAAAAERGTAVAIFIDELQYVPEAELAALITALHRARQNERPITMVAAGLPQLVGQAGRAKSYAERLFRFTTIGPLDPGDAANALVIPARARGVEYEPDAIDALLEVTGRYPYFLQEWGSQTWELATASPISANDVALATPAAVAALDDSFFRVRFDRLTPLERRYLRAMAALGPGPTRSTDIAARLGRTVRSVGPVRDALIKKGMIYSPAHGDSVFTVPLFDAYMRRVMPEATE